MEVLNSVTVLIWVLFFFFKNHSGWWVNTDWGERDMGLQSSKLDGSWNNSVKQVCVLNQHGSSGDAEKFSVSNYIFWNMPYINRSLVMTLTSFCHTLFLASCDSPTLGSFIVCKLSKALGCFKPFELDLFSFGKASLMAFSPLLHLGPFSNVLLIKTSPLYPIQNTNHHALSFIPL